MAAEKAKSISISVSTENFPRTMYFNRCTFDRSGPARIFYFGFVDEEDYLRDVFACAIDETTLTRQKDDLLNYVAKATTRAPTNLPEWRPKVSSIPYIRMANFIRAARTGENLAELELFNYSIGDVIDAGRTGKTEVKASPIASLRCEDGLQQAILLSIYSQDRRSSRP
jgi:hypothetical protein